MLVSILDVIFVRRYAGKGAGSHLCTDIIVVSVLDVIFVQTLRW